MEFLQKFSHTALLRIHTNHNTFISLPQRWSSYVTTASLPTFCIESSNVSLIVTWNGQTHACGDEEYIGINSTLMLNSGLKENDFVLVKQMPQPPPFERVSVKVNSLVEWEELILNFEAAQTEFLNQTRVIKLGQKLPLWLEGGSLVIFEVLETVPSAPAGLLIENTQLRVLPPDEDTTLSPVPVKLDNSLAPNLDLENEGHTRIIDRNNDNLLKYNFLSFVMNLISRKSSDSSLYIQSQIDLTLRVHPYPVNASHSISKTLLNHPTFVIITKRYLLNSIFEDKVFFIGKMKKLHCFKANECNLATKIINDLEIAETKKPFEVVVLVWENVRKSLLSGGDESILCSLNNNGCIVSNPLQRQYSLDTKSVVSLTTAGCNAVKEGCVIDVCSLTSWKNNSTSMIQLLKDNLVKICDTLPVIINPTTLVTLNSESDTVEDVLVSVRNKNTLYLDKIAISSVQIIPITRLQNVPFIQKYLGKSDEFESSRNSYEIYADIIQELKLFILESLISEHVSSLSPQFILLQGGKGTGKSSLIKSLTNDLSARPYYIHCDAIKLKMLKGKKVEAIYKILREVIQEGIFHAPSLIILDDLDILVPQPLEGQEGSASEYFSHLALMIKSCLQQLYCEINKRNLNLRSHPFKISVSILVTCSSLDSLHHILGMPQGTHLFPKMFRIQSLNDDKGLACFESLLLQFYEEFPKCTVDHELKSYILSDNAKNNIYCYNKKLVTTKLKNLTLPDIKNLALRVFFEAKWRWKRYLEECKKISKVKTSFYISYLDGDVSNALVDFLPLAKRALQTPERTAPDIDVGGLDSARKMLEETIEWPSKYPNLFAQSSLRLRSGVLLFGPPGCGKTLLVNSVAKKSQLNFITIKGPELLSKYIGQSEKAVRDAFDRAEAAKPCILFFDEFDSIAPRRGRDNTGVTDRVVNQLLTQMDGVEGLSGVFILAATSRPDLIDPALLRPGRLDKCIHCPMPNVEERERICASLLKNVRSEESVDFKSIAEMTDGFTGADIQSVLSTAQIKAVKELLGASLYEDILPIVEHDTLPTPNLDLDTEENVTDDNKNALNEVKKIQQNFKDEEPKTNNSVCFDSSESPLYIKKSHILEALSEVKPSIKRQETIFYDKLYKSFVNSKTSKSFTEVIPGVKKTFA